ncbi:fibronectin type III domain-containing protein [Streptomyces sp. NPDC049910]|uniref:fibronectin type III domain-containing protein n=1 Tax=Streptomyces sp. NPDC049910 TaxID=3155278 RepID=UPI00343978CF
MLDANVCGSYWIGRTWGLGGQDGGGTLPAPSAPAVTAIGGSSVSPAWGAVEGAASYRVLRDGAVAGTSPSTSFTDSGLSPGTTYAYSVSAVDGAGAAGAPSAPVQVTTTEAPNACHTDNTYNHVAAGRAHQVQGTVYAYGSGQNMGLYDLYVTHILEETSPGYFVIADSGCPS